MKVIFVEDDRIEAVSDGYARNYLLPNKLAMIATPAALAAAEKRREKRKQELEKRKAEMQALAEKLAALEIVVEADAGEGGKLFGSVTAADIAEAARKAGGVEIDKRKILLEEPIRTIGEYSVPLKLHPDVTAALKLKVSAK
jgi:large subunit ribosomal protein L9